MRHFWFFVLVYGFGAFAGPVRAQISTELISLVAPPNGSDIAGPTSLSIAGPSLTSVQVKCWKQGGEYGSDSIVGTVILDQKGNGSLIFPAAEYPHGPLTIRFSSLSGRKPGSTYLQVYNKSGISWNEGIPASAPPAAKDLKLVFADDFTGSLSIGNDAQSRYYPHKPGGGDFGQYHFANFHPGGIPFLQVDNYLRIRADTKSHLDGLLSSLRKEGTGFTARAPCYFECRFIAPSAPGTWPAFWLMTDYLGNGPAGAKGPADELDVIEAYGGEGPHNPNSHGDYRATSHYWNQGDAGKAQKGIGLVVPMRKIGGGSSWWETFHTYGCKVTETDTIYYCDNIEVGRHPTGAISRTQPLFFMVNLAVGGNGWPVDLSQCQGIADMYVDYVRVYQGTTK